MAYVIAEIEREREREREIEWKNVCLVFVVYFNQLSEAVGDTLLPILRCFWPEQKKKFSF